MMQFIQDQIQQLTVVTGLDNASLKILICALLSFPFSAIFKRLPDKSYTLKNSYIISVSAFYIFGILALYSGFQTLAISCLGTYFITRYVRSPSMPWINFFFLMGHLCYNHLHSQFFQIMDRSKIDITGAQMVLVMKLSAFGWNVYDGKTDIDQLSGYLKSRVVKSHPNLLEYFGYCFFYPSLLTGPAFDFADYQKFIKSELFDDVPEDRRPGKPNKKRKIPRSGRVAAWKTLQGFVWAIIMIKSGEYFSMKFMLTDEFNYERSFIFKIFYFWFIGFTYRLKYYCIWSIAEGSCILCGIGYNGYDKQTGNFLWNRVQNVDPWAFETGQNVHVCLEAWNMNTNKWLKNYVYIRVARPGKKPGFRSTLFTFLTSAFWHGTRPGYYLAFAAGAFCQTCGKIFRKQFRPIFLQADGKTPKSTKIVYDIICYFVTQLTFGYIVQPFYILDFKKSLYVWSTTYYYGHIFMALVLILFRGPLSKPVIAFVHKFHPKPVEKKKEPVVVVEVPIAKLVAELSEEEEEGSEPFVALPSASFANLNVQEVEKEIEEMKKQFSHWKRRGSIDAEEGFKDAYRSFTSEVKGLFPASTKNGKEE